MTPPIAGMVRGGLLLLAGAAVACQAAPAAGAPAIHLELAAGSDLGTPLKILLGLTILSLAPAILMSMTAFIRIVIVLAMLRHALGMQETPPNTVVVSLALFLTLFTMAPVIKHINHNAAQPYLAGQLDAEQAARQAVTPLRDFMVRQTREQDMALMVDLAKTGRPETVEDIALEQLVPAFMLSELRTGFQIGFVIFLPFLLVDLLVASSLMSLGMMMVPPASIALPLKILLFVLMDGWNLVVRALLGTFA